MKLITLILATLLLTSVENNQPSQATTFLLEIEENELDASSENLPNSNIQTSITEWQAWRDTALFYANSGKISDAESALKISLDLLEPLQNNPQYEQWQARVLDVEGKIQLLRGENEKALKTWQRTAEIYQKNEDSEHFSQAVLNQIQALQNLGYYHQALKQLEPSLNWLDKQPNSPIKVKTLRTFGDISQHLGDLELANAQFTEALAIAKANNYSDLLPELNFSLAALSETQGEILTAAQTYQALSEANTLGLKAQINLLYLLQTQSKLSQTLNLTVDQQTTNILSRLESLPPSRPTIYSRIDFAQHLLHNSQPPRHLIQEQLTLAYQQAKILGDRRSQAYALGTLGKLYFNDQRFPEAQHLSEKALTLSQELNAPELIYQWQWQLGKIQQNTNHRKEAIAAYTESLKNLEAIRSDLVAVSSDVQFSFREDIEPVYRELASLLLHNESTQAELKQAREVIEKLQLAELDNFFRDACLDVKPTQIDQVDPHAAIFYTIILGDRLEVIVAVPNQLLEHYSVQKSAIDIQNNIYQSIRDLTSAQKYSFTRITPKFNSASLQTFYQDLIQPILSTLQQQNIETLIFILDGELKRLPMGALYDGKQFLIEQYNVAIAPSLQLIDPTPFKDLETKKKQVLSAGISKAIRGFDPLPSVENELTKIQQETQAQVLLNEQFTTMEFSTKVENFPYEIVHIATHGEFSSRLEDTFILTWDNRLNISELQALLQGDSKQLRPIELLVLSACTTAQGDSRATLGLAGMAVRSGARSTIASLWSVDDDATAILMGHFYRYLTEGKRTKAEALRQAQRDLLTDPQFSHPYYWSAFTLIGNWL